MNIKQLFDYNVIVDNPSLDAMIQDTLSRYECHDRVELAETDLEVVTAAGSVALGRKLFNEKED